MPQTALQVVAALGPYCYVVYVGIYRTAYGIDGRHDPKGEYGLLVRRGDQTMSSRSCRAPSLFNPLTRKLMPGGEYVRH